MARAQQTIIRHLTLAEKIQLCHERIPTMRHIIGFQSGGFIADLPIWSETPKKYRKTAKDDFCVWGLEAQHPRYLPEILKPYIHWVKNKKTVCCVVDDKAYKNRSA